MVKVYPHEHCRDCNGVGLMRNDNPMSDRVYGEHCPSCNGTGMRSDPNARRLAFLLFVVLNILTLVVFLKACS